MEIKKKNHKTKETQTNQQTNKEKSQPKPKTQKYSEFKPL